MTIYKIYSIFTIVAHIHICIVQISQILKGGNKHMARSRKGYLGLGWIISIIIAIIFGWIGGVLERLLRGNLLGAILALPFILGWLFWWIDVICLVLYRDIKLLA